jgi:hypothetical protein
VTVGSLLLFLLENLIGDALLAEKVFWHVVGELRLELGVEELLCP